MRNIKEYRFSTFNDLSAWMQAQDLDKGEIERLTQESITDFQQRKENSTVQNTLDLINKIYCKTQQYLEVKATLNIDMGT